DQSAIVAFTDARGRITHANDQFCAISGYSREELLGQDHRVVNSGYHPREFMQDLWRTIAHGGIWRGEIRNRRKNGTYYWVDTTIVPLLDGQGKPQQYLAIRFDITSRKAAEARLREQASLTQLGELAAVVAHEVRNPLAGLRGSLQVLASRLPAEMREKQIIGTMIERIDVLNNKVQDLLLFARPRPPRPAAVDLRQMLIDVAASSSAAVKPSVVDVVVTGDAPAARADAEMLREVLLNVTLNACQASPDGQTVDVRLGTKDGRVEVVVTDRGPGIPPEVRERLFTPFFTTKRRGTGLGLAIVKRLLELQDGTIALEPAPGGGTMATITLPRHDARQPSAPQPQEAAVAGGEPSGR
ncbi:MAG TPA: ATP-binding protein, partial [Vicinamibacterales bacterium]